MKNVLKEKKLNFGSYIEWLSDPRLKKIPGKEREKSETRRKALLELRSRKR